MTKNSSVLEIRKNFTNDQWKDDVKHSTQLNWWFLKAIGIWPSTGSSKFSFKTTLLKMQPGFSYFLIVFLLLPCALHTFLEEEDMGIRLKLIGPMSFCLMSFFKYSFLVFRARTIDKCFSHVRQDWMSIEYDQDRTIMLRNAKLGRRLAIVCAIFMYGGGLFYHTIMPLTSGTIVTEFNVTIRPLTYPFYGPLLNAQKSPVYEIIFVTQFLSGFMLYSVTIGACSLAALFVSHACGQLQIVISRLQNLVNGRQTEASSQSGRMAFIIQHHLRVLDFITIFEHLLREICLVEFVGCTLNLCLLGYYFITEWEHNETIGSITYCILFISFTFNIFIFCYIGEILTEQCEEVGSTSYMIDWYRLPGKSALDLILMNIISNSPTKITAGKLVELSLGSFCGVIKTSMAYLNLLRTLLQ